VGGDVQAATDRAAWMVGACGMPPEFIELRSYDETEDEARDRVMKKFQRIGTQIVNRTHAGSAESAVLHDPSQRQMVEQLLGQAYLAAHHLMEANREAVGQIADALVEKRELYGDEVLRLLDAQTVNLPEVDLTKEEAWPRM
jgi:cell division protease FtsH